MEKFNFCAVKYVQETLNEKAPYKNQNNRI